MTVEELETRLAKLEAIEDIRRLKFEYAWLCDNGNPPDKIAELFTEDAVWDNGDFGRYEGRDEIRGYFARVNEISPWSAHHMVQPVITVNEDGSASGRWYLWDPCLLTVDGETVATWIAGVYEDAYRQIDGRWYFAHVRLQLSLMSRYDDGWAERRIAS